MNTYGERFRVTTYGESHGLAVGAVIDGCPAGMAIDMDAVEQALLRRRNGAPRTEADRVVWLSGMKDGVTLGTPLAFSIGNGDSRPDDYDRLEHLFRPGHADYTYHAKYGLRDHRGGGRASARETTARVVAGCVARQLMPELAIEATVAETGPRLENDTCGGIVQCRVTGLPAGVGEPVFGKLGASLASAMMSIPSAIGFEMGAGFAAALMTGSQYVDRWSGLLSPITTSNHCGGVQGGISNGMPIEFRVAFHPVATLPQTVECLHEDGHLEPLDVGGRHDRCAVTRVPVIVESMAALCLINYLL
ncbi:MAG: chorismate synthase [Bacteroidales bacterium]|nr:chorismate synthase [Bacteroidales bacterium]